MKGKLLLKSVLKLAILLFVLAFGFGFWLERENFMKDLSQERIEKSPNFVKDKAVGAMFGFIKGGFVNKQNTSMMISGDDLVHLQEEMAKNLGLKSQNLGENSQKLNEKSVNLNSTQNYQNSSENSPQSKFQAILSLLNTPKVRITSIKSDLTQMQEASFVWFGHSSYLIKLGGKHILIDPILQDNAAPVPFIIKAFNGADIYTPYELPNIDFLIITHNHYDHLSKKTIKALAHKVDKAIVPLGVGKYLKAWGIDESDIIELDWDEVAKFDDFVFHCLTTRHFSGRGLFDQNKSLWASFLLEHKGKRLFFGGDSGYGEHFRDFGERFESIDIAFLENGQFNEQWAFIHAFPHQSLQIASELHAKALMSVHNAKFKLAPHAWNEPLRQLHTLYTRGSWDFELLMPQIGQITPLWEKFELKPWWN